jgi:ABC-2 type transport system ATP-binding protein
MNNNLQIDSLSKIYNGVEVVKSISFAIKRNEIIGLLGPNGCGKTTTIGMILGLLKPSSGKVLIDNKDIEKNRVDILKKINFISP